MDLKISQLPAITARTHDDLIAIVQSGTTSKITVDDFFSEPYIDAGSVSGTIAVDVSDNHYFIFTLVGNVDVTLNNVKSGKEYLFWVYANGNYTVDSMVVTGYDLYSVGGSLPNPNNNSWNLYRGLAIDGDFILTEIGNFSQVV